MKERHICFLFHLFSFLLVVKTCPVGSGLILNDIEECVCPIGYILDHQGICVPCRFDLGFVVEQGQCICDVTKNLVLDVTGKKCVCPDKHFLNDNGICEQGECVIRTTDGNNLQLEKEGSSNNFQLF